MKLQTLLEGLSYQTALQEDMEITGVTCDNRQAEAGNLFVCLRGLRTDGHDWAAAALRAGAAAVLCEKDLGLPAQVLVEDSRRLMRSFAPICLTILSAGSN
jgi:UDP-N-acetylmuramoyl-L-alanyl-D-glutamate--2,6-diaminopimelate ligase